MTMPRTVDPGVLVVAMALEPKPEEGVGVSPPRRAGSSLSAAVNSRQTWMTVVGVGG